MTEKNDFPPGETPCPRCGSNDVGTAGGFLGPFRYWYMPWRTFYREAPDDWLTCFTCDWTGDL